MAHDKDNNDAALCIPRKKLYTQTGAESGFPSNDFEALKYPKVRVELGSGGALKETSERLELLKKDYTEVARRLK